MTRLKWFRNTGVPVVALVIAGTIGATRATKPGCEIAAGWAADHDASLPRTYAALAPYSPTYRRAIYNRLSVNERVELWRAHFADVESQIQLTDDQRELIKTVEARLAVYLDGSRGRRAIKTDSIEHKVRVAFGDSLAHTVFVTLGPKEVNAPDAVAQLPKLYSCNCATGTNFSCIGGDCGGYGCQAQPGCGFLGCALCDGCCNSDIC